MSASTRPGPNGITAHAASAGISITTGARKNSDRSACDGEMISLIISLNASAIGCSSPSGPTRLGPMRICIQPISLALPQRQIGDQPEDQGATIATIFVSVQTDRPGGAEQV